MNISWPRKKVSHDDVAFSLILVSRGGTSFNLKLQFVYLRTHINCELMEIYRCSCPSCTTPRDI